MQEFEYVSESIDQTDRLGAALARQLPDGSVVALIGTLGAGKTRLVQSVAANCGIDPEEVTSPTFVLCREYRSERDIFHFDAYRITDDDEFLELGPDEYYDSDGLTFIEWADRVIDCLPPMHWEIEIEVTGEQSRRCRIRTNNTEDDQVLAHLEEQLSP